VRAWNQQEDIEAHLWISSYSLIYNAFSRSMLSPQMYRRPTDANQKAVIQIMRGGIRFACLDLPQRAEFLGYGLGNFIGRLSPENAGAMSEHLTAEAAAALRRAGPEHEELIENFKSHLEVGYGRVG
jgi:hypothetical protein